MYPLMVNCRFLSQKVTGTQRVAVELCKQMKKLYPSIPFLSPKNILQKNVADMLGVTVVGNSTGQIWGQWELPRFLKKQGCPVLLNLCNLAPLRYPKNIVTIFDLSPFREPLWFSFAFRTYYRFMVPRIIKKAQRILTGSNFSKSEMIGLLGVPENQICVTPYAIAENILQLAQKPTYNSNGKYLLAVSSIDPRKNFSRLIQAFVNTNLKDVKIIFVGAKNKSFNNMHLEENMENKENLIFKGYLTDEELVNLYKNALCLVYSSLYEGFGLPPLEAMACGCPVVISKVASLPEVCGDAACYIDPYDVESIAQGIKKVLADKELRDTLIRKGYERIKMFSWRKCAIDTMNICREVCQCENGHSSELFEQIRGSEESGGNSIRSIS